MQWKWIMQWSNKTQCFKTEWEHRFFCRLVCLMTTQISLMTWREISLRSFSLQVNPRLFRCVQRRNIVFALYPKEKNRCHMPVKKPSYTRCFSWRNGWLMRILNSFIRFHHPMLMLLLIKYFLFLKKIFPMRKSIFFEDSRRCFFLVLSLKCVIWSRLEWSSESLMLFFVFIDIQRWINSSRVWISLMYRRKINISPMCSIFRNDVNIAKVDQRMRIFPIVDLIRC